MAWRVAKSISTLRAQVNDIYPDRRKSSDGTIGDENHQKNDSDHNPWVRDGNIGVVTAIDFTHDPSNGIDAGKLAQALIDSRDPRIKYVISNRRICAGHAGPKPWQWRNYTGKNPHTKHMHLSVMPSLAVCDNTVPWNVRFPTDVKPEDEKSLVKSKIGQGTATIGTIEAVDVGVQVNNAIEAAAQAKNAADSLGIDTPSIMSKLIENPRFWIALAVIIIAIAIAYWRWRDHGKGQDK